MKLATIMIIVQAVFMLATLAATCYMVYGLKTDTTENGRDGDTIWKANAAIFYVIVGLHGMSLVIQGLSVFWCQGR